jgi:hypothetical protein
VHRARQALRKITRKISSLGTAKKQTILHSGSKQRSRIRITVNLKARFTPEIDRHTDRLSKANLFPKQLKNWQNLSAWFFFALNSTTLMCTF